MFCKNCGKEIADDSKFCSFCGKRTESEDADFNDSCAEQFAVWTANRNLINVGMAIPEVEEIEADKSKKLKKSEKDVFARHAEVMICRLNGKNLSKKTDAFL